MTKTRALGQQAQGQKAATQRPPRPATQRPPRRRPSGAITLTGRGAVVALFAVCFLGLPFAAWTGWSVFADVMFVTACGVVTCYTRVSGLSAVVVCPPLAFFAGCILTQVLTATDAFSAATGILITLGSSAPWLFTGTVLVVAITLGRGWRPRWPAIRVLGNLREALRGIQPRGDLWVRNVTTSGAANPATTAARSARSATPRE